MATDWRVWAVLIAVLVTLILTGAIYGLGLGLHPETHFGAIFASWVGGVALFVVAGAVVAIVSLARPEEEAFDARARILFRRQTGKHINYIINRIGEILEQYAESQVITITIEKYDSTAKKYFIRINNETIIRSYIDDIPSTYKSKIEYEEISLPPTNETANALAFLRAQGDVLRVREEFSDKISHEFTSLVAPHSSSKIELEIRFWVTANTEANSHMCVRYTQIFELKFQNHIDRPIKLNIKRLNDTRAYETIVNPGESPKSVAELKDLPPGVEVAEFHLLEP